MKKNNLIDKYFDNKDEKWKWNYRLLSDYLREYFEFEIDEKNIIKGLSRENKKD